MSWLKLSLIVGVWNSLGISAAVTPFSDTKSFELVRDMPLRMANAVFVDGKLYFSIYQGVVSCPSRDLYRVTLDKANSSKVVERLSEIPCVVKLETDDKNLFVQIRQEKQLSPRLEVLIGDKLVPIEEHPAFGQKFLDRKAWLKFELHKLSDKLEDPSIRGASISAWEVKRNSTPQGIETVLHFLLSTEVVDGKTRRQLYGRFPLEDADRKKRSLIQLSGELPEGEFSGTEFVVTAEGKIVITIGLMTVFSAESGKSEPLPMGAGIERLAPHHVTATSTGVILLGTDEGIENQFLHVVPGISTVSLRAATRDVFGLSRLQDGTLMTKGWTGSIIWYSDREPEGALKDWQLAKDFTVLSSENGKAQPVASALFVTSQFPQPMRNMGCASHRVWRESEGVVAIYSSNSRESVSLGSFEGVESGACSGGAIALLAKKFSPRLRPGHLKMDLEQEGTEKAGEGGTNVEQALALKGNTSNTSEILSPDSPLLFVIQNNALVLVRKSFEPTRFFRIRPNGAAGFLIWLQQTNELFTDYINTAAANGRDFYNSNIIEHPLPDASRTHFETEEK